MTVQQHLGDWLRDAYAMEQQALSLLQRQLDRIKNYPELSDRIQLHKQETEWQIEQLEYCLKKLGTDSSMLKNLAGKVTANIAAFGNMFASDEVIKDTIVSAVFEHFESVCYKILIVAAQHAGEMEIAGICESILKQEESMAQWFEEHLADTTLKFLSRNSLGLEAKI